MEKAPQLNSTEETKEEPQRAIISDIDNVLLNSLCLTQFEPSDPCDDAAWDIVASHFVDCTINNWCVNLIKNYTGEILFVTSRNNKGNTEEITKNSIIEAIGNRPFELFMRPDGDLSPSHILKKKIYDKYIKGIYDIELVIDDELSNILMFKSLGLNVLHRVI